MCAPSSTYRPFDSSRRNPSFTHRLTAAVAAAAFFSATTLPGEDAVVSTSPSSAAPTADDTDSGPSVFSLQLPLRAGPFEFHPHARYEYVQADGVQSHPGEKRSTSIQSFSPGLMTRIGDSWYLDYTAKWIYYSNPSFTDNLSHSAYLSGRVHHERWSANVSHRYSFTSVPLVETGQQTKIENHASKLQFYYEVGLKTRVEVTLGQHIRHTENFADARSRSAGAFLYYSTLPWLQVAGGVSFAKDEADATPDADSTRYQVRAHIRTTDKISCQLYGGVESRKVKGEIANDTRTPVYGAEATYHIFEPTTIRLSGDRETTTSFFQNQYVRGERWQLTVTQRLFEHFVLSLDYAYRHSQYTAVALGTPTVRTDNGTTYRAKLATKIRSRTEASVYYSRAENRSSLDQFTFKSNQVGFEISYRL